MTSILKLKLHLPERIPYLTVVFDLLLETIKTRLVDLIIAALSHSELTTSDTAGIIQLLILIPGMTVVQLFIKPR